jgi:6-phosphogluconolactonase (cycloisomerase 2 family)/DNA-binding winged helix-turn-helix (wHTH) protein
MTTVKPAQTIRFGPYEVDLRNRCASRLGRRINIQPQPFRVLALLLESDGELVTREELRRSLWPDGLYVDFEHGLNRSINKLRFILHDKADAPRYIETVPGCGYRFIAPVERLERPDTPIHVPDVSHPPATVEPHSSVALAPAVIAAVPEGRSAGDGSDGPKHALHKPAGARVFIPEAPWRWVSLLTLVLAIAAAILLEHRMHAHAPGRRARVASVENRRFLYVADYSAGAVLAFTIDPLSGALQPIPANSFKTRQHPYALSLSTPYLYVVNRGLGDEVCGDGCNISAYVIDPLSGALTQLEASPFPAGMGPVDIATHPSLRYLYAVSVGSNTLQTYSRVPGGALQPVGKPVPLGRHPFNLAITPSGRFIYVSNQDDANLSAFVLDPDGQPKAVPGSPFATGLRPRGMSIDPSGRHLYVVNYGVNPLPERGAACAGQFYGVRGVGCTLSAFTIDQLTGALSPVPGSPFRSDGVNPLASVIDSAGKYLFVANITSNDVSVYRIDPLTGALRGVRGSPFPAGNGPNALALDWSENYLYVSNAFSRDITQFAIEDDGSLTPLGHPVSAGFGPLAIAVQRGTGK